MADGAVVPQAAQWLAIAPGACHHTAFNVKNHDLVTSKL